MFKQFFSSKPSGLAFPDFKLLVMLAPVWFTLYAAIQTADKEPSDRGMVSAFFMMSVVFFTGFFFTFADWASKMVEKLRESETAIHDLEQTLQDLERSVNDLRSTKQ